MLLPVLPLHCHQCGTVWEWWILASCWTSQTNSTPVAMMGGHQMRASLNLTSYKHIPMCCQQEKYVLIAWWALPLQSNRFMMKLVFVPSTSNKQNDWIWVERCLQDIWKWVSRCIHISHTADHMTAHKQKAVSEPLTHVTHLRGTQAHTKNTCTHTHMQTDTCTHTQRERESQFFEIKPSFRSIC